MSTGLYTLSSSRSSFFHFTSAKMPIVYEVNVSVDMNVSEEYKVWLKSHIEEILTLPGFLRTSLCALPLSRHPLTLCPFASPYANSLIYSFTHLYIRLL